MSTTTRGSWNSKLGFILAASGSAIGLGNIVFFSSNAYQYGGGAFYLPYFFALFVLGLPIMMLEFGLGTMTGKSFPLALRQVSGRKGEFLGWWAIISALFITSYYIALLGWAFGMMLGAFNGLFEPGVTAPFAPFAEPSPEPSAMIFFFDLIASWKTIIFILIIWSLNMLILWRGTSTIEKVVRVFVPLMWLFMICLVIRGATLEGGFNGIMYLFTPDFSGIADPTVWKGAFSQMFFSLSLGLGTMTAYASYLPKDSDQINNSMLVSFLNCGFEFIAGLAIFSILFVFALNPAGTTLSLSFFVIPQGIGAISEYAWVVKIIGFAFFLLLVVAGLTSSISLIEGPASALIDKLKISRAKALAMIAIPGFIGSILFGLPTIVDPDLINNGTLGLNLLDITDHWVFGYALLVVGFVQTVLMGWVLGADKLRAALNKHSKIKLGKWYEILIKFIAPALLLGIIVLSLLQEEGLYGHDFELAGMNWLAIFIPIFWLVVSIGGAAYLTTRE